MLLSRVGVSIHGAVLAGNATHCCGGPIEMTFPERSNAIVVQRVARLRRVSDRVVTLWPLSLATLHRVAPPKVEVTDVSTHLAGSYCPLASTIGPTASTPGPPSASLSSAAEA